MFKRNDFSLVEEDCKHFQTYSINKNAMVGQRCYKEYVYKAPLIYDSSKLRIINQFFQTAGINNDLDL